MAKDYSRSQRVADFLQRELAMLIQKELRDPRISFVDVTAVEVSRDFSHAKVFVTFLNIAQSKAVSADDRIAVLNKAAGFLRAQLAKNSTMRTIPRLVFHFDSSIERGSKMSQLIEQVVAEDKARRSDADDD